MEIFIDLAKITEGLPEPSLPGIDLNLAGLVNFNKSDESPAIAQGQLKTETELSLPNFNPLEYFGQIQTEFDKIRLAQESFSINDNSKILQAAQQNSTVALDSLASYLEEGFNKIGSLANDKTEIGQLIQGQFDNKLSDIQSIVNNQLTQTTELEKESSISSITNTLSALVTDLIEKPIPVQAENIPGVTTNQLVNSQETRFDQTSQNISNLSETISNFATNILNGATSNISAIGQISPLNEPTKNILSITKEVERPDFGAASLSALKQMADNTQTLTNSSNFITNTTSQVNTNTVNQGQPQAGMEMAEGGGGNTTVMMPGNQPDNSAVYLMQMLNLMKSGQLRVKL